MTVVEMKNEDFILVKLNENGFEKDLGNKISQAKGSIVSALEVFAVLGYLFAQANLNSKDSASILVELLKIDIFNSEKGSEEKIDFILKSLASLGFISLEKRG
jgi:hypothetical protein